MQLVLHDVTTTVDDLPRGFR